MLIMFRGAMLIGALLTAGCITAPAPPQPVLEDYVQPANLTSENAATIAGSRVENSNLFIGDVRIFVSIFDNTRTPIGEDPQSALFLVNPGTHSVRIFLHRNATPTSQAHYAWTDQSVELEAGKMYVARGELRSGNALLWMEEFRTASKQAGALTPVRTLKPPIVVPILIVR
jgi:hypothetical protein